MPEGGHEDRASDQTEKYQNEYQYIDPNIGLRTQTYRCMSFLTLSGFSTTLFKNSFT